jgi:hypothetical protein
MTDDDIEQRNREVESTTTILLAEFAARRSEIDTRGNVLVSLILGNLTVLGVVLGIALSHSGDRSILLLLPIVTPCIGLLVIDSFRSLSFLNGYIYKTIRPRLRVNDTEIFDWERQSSKFVFRPLVAVPFQLVLWLEFLGPPLAVFIYAWEHHYLHHPWAWWTGMVLTVILLFCAGEFGWYSLFNSDGARKMFSSTQAASSANLADLLAKLAGVRDQGLITPQEFECVKAKILA